MVFQRRYGLVGLKRQNIQKEEHMYHLITTDLMIINLMFLLQKIMEKHGVIYHPIYPRIIQFMSLKKIMLMKIYFLLVQKNLSISVMIEELPGKNLVAIFQLLQYMTWLFILEMEI